MTAQLEHRPALPNQHQRSRPRFAPAVLCLILASSFLIKLNHLGHASINPVDESFHAVVARNLLKAPFKPMLYADPVLAYDYQDWKANHVWLHKPIWPLWQMINELLAS